MMPDAADGGAGALANALQQVSAARRPRKWLSLLIVCAVLTPINLTAHSDPSGDVHPKVQVENDNFAIYFNDNSTSARSAEIEAPDTVYRVVYSPLGELLAPRHRGHDIDPETLGFSRDANVARVGDDVIEVTGLSNRAAEPAGYVLTRGSATEKRLLPWPADRPGGVESVVATTDALCVASAHGNKLYLHQFSRTDPTRFKSVVIGEPAFIYMFPIASNLIAVDGRFWIGWVRWNRAEKKHETVLSVWNETMAEPVHHVLHEPSDWNSHLSLAAIGQRLCLAYHCQTGDELDGKSRIVTVFRPATVN